MTTHITLEDGRGAWLSDGAFDGILEAAADELARSSETLDGLEEWLLDQRCSAQGFGVGYLDLRELSPRASSEFRFACLEALAAVERNGSSPDWLHRRLAEFAAMWESIERGDPPESPTQAGWVFGPPDLTRHGPGWG